MSGWEPELEELRAPHRELARRMGGEEKVAKHRAQGKLTVRERIDALLDPGSFHEIGALDRPRHLRRQRTRGRRDARELRDGPRTHRRPARGRGRRRLHGAGRRGRRVDLPEAGARGANGARAAAADRPPRRRLGRRRIGEVARDRAPLVRAVQPGLGARRGQPGHGSRRVVVPGLGRGAGRGAGRHQPLQRDGEGHVAAVRRGAARGRAARRDGRQGDARRQRDPHAQRRRRRRGRERTRGVRAGAPLPVISPAVGPRAAAPDRAHRRSRAARRRARDRDPAQPAHGLQGALDHRARRRHRFVVRARAFQRPLRGHGSRAPRRLAGRDPRQRPLLLRGRLDCERVGKGHALRGSRRDVPPPGRAPRRQSRLRDRNAGRARRDDPRRRTRARRGVPGVGAVVLGDPAQGLRRRRRRASGRVDALVPDGVAVGELGQPPTRRRHRGRVQGAARGRRRPAPRCAPRSRPSSASRQSPFRTAEAFLVEEIVDPRDTRPLLCEFANLAAPLRRPGPSAHGLRP